jgi:endonuclease/exonuclease/phosphatase family metal-dependent hydrolase
MMISQNGKLRVLSINVAGRNEAWEDRRKVLMDGIRNLEPDLVAVHESIYNKEYDQVLDLVGPDFHIAHQKARDPQGMGISMASRWPIGELHEIGLHVTARTENFPCGTLVVEALAPPPIGPLLFVNHFPNWQLNYEHERELQAVVAAQFIEEMIRKSKRQVILVGDFDGDPQASSVRFWAGRQSLQGLSVCYRDAWESAHPNEAGHTFTPLNPMVKDQIVKGGRPFRDWPFRRIDYIFVRYGEHGSQALDIESCERIFDSPIDGVQASDHYGLVANLSVPVTID